MEALALPAILISAANTFCLLKPLRHTTARAAVVWGLLAVASCLLPVMLKLSGVSIAAVSACQYLTAVLLLTPSVYILGARRPGVQAWPWFVILPLIVILQWPTATQLPYLKEASPVQIPLPTVIGFLFVLLMGTGNFFGTRSTGTMLLGTAGVVVLLYGVTEMNPSFSTWPLIAGCWIIAIASFGLPRISDSAIPNQEDAGSASTALWLDFQDIYGIVWAKRVMDRINLFAAREDWNVELTLDGFQPRDQRAVDRESGDASEDSLRPIHLFCWLMKRFVDREFLLNYLPESVIPAGDREDEGSMSP